MENPMRQSMRTPIMSMGVIPGKVHLDWLHIREAMENGEDGSRASTCYPGGSKDVNHDVMPGDLSIGYKCARSDTGGFNELGFVSLAGLDTSAYATHREMEDNFYPQGFVVTECRVSDPMNDPMAQDPDHGYAIVKAGTVPTINNGPFPIYPNQLVAMRFPPSNLSGDLRRGEDIAFGSSNHRARQGTFSSQIRPELVPFDYTDFRIHYDDAYHSMTTSKNMRGISDMSFNETIARRKGYITDSSKLSLEQEEAAGHYWGTLNLIIATLEVLNADDSTVTVATRLNQMRAAVETGTGVNDIVRRIFANAYQNDIVARGSKDEVIVPTENVLKLRQLASAFHSGHVLGNFYSKASKIVGRSMNYAGPSETMDMLAQHTCL
jgi:hypothetical protein